MFQELSNYFHKYRVIINRSGGQNYEIQTPVVINWNDPLMPPIHLQHLCIAAAFRIRRIIAPLQFVHMSFFKHVGPYLCSVCFCECVSALFLN